MKPLSIRQKITLWYAGALVIVMLFTCFAVLSASNQIIQKTIRDSLVETVEHNIDEIEYFDSIEELVLTNDVDQFIQYEDGYLEIDDDFLDQVNEVYTSLYQGEGALLYGENPISKETAVLSFADGQVQRLKVNGVLYYVFDRELTEENLDGLWLRGVVSEMQGRGQMTNIARIALVFLPFVMLFAIIGGYWIAGRMLRPIQSLSEVASRIEKGGDLKKRIEIGKGNDEIHQLANNFNRMFQRLDELFETERQFASDASHELRTPMAVIMAQCEYSLEEPRSADEYEQAMRVIYRQSQRMSKLIGNMLDFTRLEMKADSYEKTDLDLTELVASICEDMALVGERGIALGWDTKEKIHYTGNRELLSRLLGNLISNAYRYGVENGHIFVKLCKKEGTIELSVADDGIGIAKEEQQKIFHRFYQADNSHGGVGTGLGLSMAAQIARFHGGEIRVESEPGKGSTFTLYLTV